MKRILHQHEKDIRAYFKGDRDKIRITGTFPGKGVFVLFTNRCGSNYLVELMKQLPTLTMKNEIFNAINIERAGTKRGLETFEQYVRLMRKGCPTPHWGAKIGCVQLDMLHRFGLLDAFEEGTYIVWLKRKNIVAQAVSHFIAHHDKQWASFHEPKGDMPDYDFHSIELILRSILKHHSDAELTLGLLGVKYHGLWYEDYLAKPTPHLRGVSRFIGEPFEEIARDKSKFRKQDNAVKKEYEARFRAEAKNALKL
ncbi:Stf0 family sulfotransferase [Kordiimonas aestuarii]|uniref:Stf0 family sulfotransferase n=1 Tax=Kordiimonas aestuarii TaxID=1005925 RepID=UPI0021D14E37|nr:Stf0 family sulfotransferase [Kordiimonas aestuarii]